MGSGWVQIILRGIPPPAGGGFPSERSERNQRIAGGWLSLDAARPNSPYPRTPITGVTPWGGQNPSGAQNQECLSAVPSGPTGGLSRREIGTGAVPLPRLPLPNQRSRCEFWRAHAMRPYWFRTVGAAISRPKPFPFGGRCPRRGRMRCAAKGRLRAGQCPAPTERPERSPYFAGAGVLTRPP